VWLIGWGHPTMDAEAIYVRLFKSPNLFVNWHNEDFKGMVEEVQSQMNEKKRLAQYHRIQQAVDRGGPRHPALPALTAFHAKNAIALERLKTEFKGKVEVVQIPAPVLRDLKKFAAEVISEESEKTPMARKVHASFTKFQALVGPWDHVAEGAYHQLVAG
jgi:TRAP-type mannitol/chloroaromatic compound transport system substrate-binding protein